MLIYWDVSSPFPFSLHGEASNSKAKTAVSWYLGYSVESSFEIRCPELSSKDKVVHAGQSAPHSPHLKIIAYTSCWIGEGK